MLILSRELSLPLNSKFPFYPPKLFQRRRKGDRGMIYLSLGSNEGNRISWLQQAQDLLARSCGNITKKSSIYETAAWGLTDQPNFLNMVVELETPKTPEELLTCILAIETRLGRQRSVKWGQRTLDIDILLYNDEIIDQPNLKVPHPFMQDRRFTLLPLAEIAPHLSHPVLKKTITGLLAECPDTLNVRTFIEN